VKILIAGGGTGGHLYPALALADALKEKDDQAQVIFVGSEEGMEARIVPSRGFALRLLKVRSFSGRPSLRWFLSGFLLMVALIKSGLIIRQEKPDLVMGFGGYVSAPVLLCALLQRKRTAIHEQNVVPGRANRILASFVDLVCLSFEESRVYFKKTRKMVCTGNPVRFRDKSADRNQARTQLGLDNRRFTVGVVGGSQGARSINAATLKVYERLRDRCDFQMVHITGRGHFAEVENELGRIGKREGSAPYRIFPYMEEMNLFYQACDLVVARSGATTVAEISFFGLPAILIPYPYATQDHQRLNAEVLANKGTALVILDKDLRGEILAEKIKELMEGRGGYQEMQKRAKEMGAENAVGRIVEALSELAFEGRRPGREE
jgi:UDP-N-acetylglucosamine--N-acetylmuramyl-(pentapeptide) pyrophosphoryl-undecaprenol N-acetylglucosamine transferase